MVDVGLPLLRLLGGREFQLFLSACVSILHVGLHAKHYLHLPPFLEHPVRSHREKLLTTVHALAAKERRRTDLVSPTA